MHSTKVPRPALNVLAAFWIVMLSVFYPCGVVAADAELEAVRAGVEGVYALEEWHTESGVFLPPQVEGRLSLLNGTIMVILHDRMNESAQRTVAHYGTYVLTATEFSYRYTEPSVFTITPSSINVSHKAPWDRPRPFDVSREGSAVRLKSQSGAQEFLFALGGITYTDAGSGAFVGKRVWRRIVAE